MSPKDIHFAIKEKLQKKIEIAFYCKRVPDNCDAYSIKNYEEFIAPILENLDAQTKNSIDLRLDKLKKSKITPAVENEFSAFLFNKLANTAKIIPTSASVIKESDINKVTQCVVNFSSNCYAIRFAHSQNKIYIYQLSFQKNMNLLKVISPAQVNENIIEIQFTDENNLLVLIGNNIERSLKLALFELNLDNTSNTLKANQLCDCTINNFGMVSHAKAVIFPNSNDKKIILIKYNSEKDQETWLLTIKESSYQTQKYNFYNIQQTPFSQVNEIIFCNNSLDLALIVGQMYGNERDLHLLARNNDKASFIEQKLPIKKDFTEGYYQDLQFNKSGSICTYRRTIYRDYEMVLLNKIANKWYLAMHLKDSRYYSLRLTLDEKNIFLLKSDNISKTNLEVMSIEDKILTSTLDPVYTSGYHNKRALKCKNFYHLVKGDIDKIEFTIHPSGLAVFAYDYFSSSKNIKFIFPKQFTKLDTLKHLGSKVAYYTQKALNAHT